MWKAIKKGLDKFLEILLTAVMTILVLSVIWQVFTRYVIGRSSQWTEELATFLMIWVAMLGASVALYRGSHLGIDYFVGKFSVRKRLYIEIFVFLLIGLFSLFVMLIGGFKLVQNRLMSGQTSPALNLKIGYVYLAVPISGFFLVVYSVEIMIEKIVMISKLKRNSEPENQSPVQD